MKTKELRLALIEKLKPKITEDPSCIFISPWLGVCVPDGEKLIGIKFSELAHKYPDGVVNELVELMMESVIFFAHIIHENDNCNLYPIDLKSYIPIPLDKINEYSLFIYVRSAIAYGLLKSIGDIPYLGRITEFDMLEPDKKAIEAFFAS